MVIEVSNKEISEMLAAKRDCKQHKPDKIKENPVNVKKCPGCGALNKENAKFCVGCGKSFEEKEIEIKPEEPVQEINKIDVIEEDTFSLFIMELVLDKYGLKLIKNASIKRFDGSLKLNYEDIENIELNDDHK